MSWSRSKSAKRKSLPSLKLNLVYLQQAVYVLERLDKGMTLEQIAASCDGDTQLVSIWIDFITSMRWLQENKVSTVLSTNIYHLSRHRGGKTCHKKIRCRGGRTLTFLHGLKVWTNQATWQLITWQAESNFTFCSGSAIWASNRWFFIVNRLQFAEPKALAVSVQAYQSGYWLYLTNVLYSTA